MSVCRTLSFAILCATVVLYACARGGGTLRVASTAMPLQSPIQASFADDWPSFRFDAIRSGYNDSETTITKSNISTMIQAWVWHGTAGSFSAPIVVDGLVYLADNAGKLTAIDERTGREIWQFTLPVARDYFISTPLYYAGRLYAPTDLDNLYVIDATTGALLWSYPSDNALASFESSPIISNGRLFVGQNNAFEAQDQCLTSDQFLSLDPDSDRVFAAVNFTPAGTSGVGVWSSPVIGDDGYVYAATGNSCSNVSSPFANDMIKLDPTTLKVVWKTRGPVDEHDWDFGATPVIVGNLIVDGAKSGQIFAFDRSTGSIAWQTYAGYSNGSIIGSLATDGAHLAVVENDGLTLQSGAVIVLNAGGVMLWHLDTGALYPSFGTLSAPVIAQGMLFVAYRTANCAANCEGVSAFNVATGKQLWHTTMTSPVYGGLTIVDGGLFVSEYYNSALYCFLPKAAVTDAARMR